MTSVGVDVTQTASPLQTSVTRTADAPAAGTVEGLFVAPTAGAPMRALDSVRADADLGLEGDRYREGAGTWSSHPNSGRRITLIAAEALDRLANDGLGLGPGEARRNVIVRGIDLDSLIGRSFYVGEVRCEGLKECPPCSYLEKLTGRAGLVKALARSGGVYARVRSNGTIRLGDSVRFA